MTSIAWVTSALLLDLCSLRIIKRRLDYFKLSVLALEFVYTYRVYYANR